MALEVVNKIWGALGFGQGEADPDPDPNQYPYENNGEDIMNVNDINGYNGVESSGNIFSGKKPKVVAMPQAQSIKMIISQPTNFEQSEEICAFLKEKRSVIVNLEYVNKEVARRIVDFISGGVYALNGHIQKVSNSIFLVAPTNYEITNDMAREEIRNRMPNVSWMKNNNIN